MQHGYFEIGGVWLQDTRLQLKPYPWVRPGLLHLVTGMS
jgi:hypothetical protein